MSMMRRLVRGSERFSGRMILGAASCKETAEVVCRARTASSASEVSSRKACCASCSAEPTSAARAARSVSLTTEKKRLILLNRSGLWTTSSGDVTEIRISKSSERFGGFCTSLNRH